MSWRLGATPLSPLARSWLALGEPRAGTIERRPPRRSGAAPESAGGEEPGPRHPAQPGPLFGPGGRDLWRAVRRQGTLEASWRLGVT
jgi:hypothetical protein